MKDRNSNFLNLQLFYDLKSKENWAEVLITSNSKIAYNIFINKILNNVNKSKQIQYKNKII